MISPFDLKDQSESRIMPLDLFRTLVVGISSTALFDREAFNPHIFFDDQDVHVGSASERIPTGKVLYRSDSTLRELQAERLKKNGGETSPREDQD